MHPFHRLLSALLLVVGVLSITRASSASEEPYVLGGIKPVVIGDIAEDSIVLPSRFVVVQSAGGFVDAAHRMGDSLGNVTCVVDRAASAALQILLPSCKDRYYLPWTQLQFHSAHMGVQGGISMWWAEQAYLRLKAANARMVDLLLRSGIPLSSDMLYFHLRLETFVEAPAITTFFGDWMKPISQCHHCPLSWQTLTLEDRPSN